MVIPLFLFGALSPAAAVEGPFLGLDLGVSEPTNDNYRSHVATGVTAAPFGGYMFNDYLGIQGALHMNAQPPDDNNERPQANLKNRNQWTTMAGATVGPRFQLPLGDLFDIYLTGQGGGFKGLGGRLNQWAPGFQVGGGVDVNVTPQFSVGLFGRWNRAYMAPHPTSLAGHVDDDQGPSDARWATAGIGLKYSFNGPQAAPPPPPPAQRVAQAPPPVVPPTKKKMVLRNVNFDFDRATIRPDAVAVLDAAVETLKTEAGIKVVVEGHTDSKGTEAYNVNLAQRRAQSVKQYLVKRGISSARIATEGIGESQPVASNDSEDGRSQNRRVELRVE